MTTKNMPTSLASPIKAMCLNIATTATCAVSSVLLYRRLRRGQKADVL
ncbi:MAG: hypothetical protein ACLUOF_09185 [Ruminococcus sp.]